jgi:hypothetical protein
MNRPLSAREQRLVALLILTGLIALVYFAVIHPIAAGFAARDARREQLLGTYAHNVRTIASIPRLRRRAEQQRASITAFVLPARNVEAGREALKDRLQRVIEAAGGEFREGADGEGPAGWVQVRATARMTLPQLGATLARLGDERPYLIVDTLTIGADTALVIGQSSAMDIQIEASIPLRPAPAR